MSEAIDALRRELGFVIIENRVVANDGDRFYANERELALWSALLASRERNAKLVEAGGALISHGRWHEESCDAEYNGKCNCVYGRLWDDFARLLEEGKEQSK